MVVVGVAIDDDCNVFNVGYICSGIYIFFSCIPQSSDRVALSIDMYPLNFCLGGPM